jgi:hypothetical protein
MELCRTERGSYDVNELPDNVIAREAGIWSNAWIGGLRPNQTYADRQHDARSERTGERLGTRKRVQTPQRRKMLEITRDLLVIWAGWSCVLHRTA